MSNFDVRFFQTSQHLDYIINMLTNLRKSRLTNLNQKLNPKKNPKNKNNKIIGGACLVTTENKKEVKLLQPKIDIVFQSLFNAKNKEITKSFVEALLEEKIDSMIINNEKEITRDKPIDKLGILDLELDINNKEKVDVEVQLLKNDEFIHRLLFYWSRIYSKQIHRGDEYTKARKVVIIAITDFEIDVTKELKRMETIWNVREKENPEKVLTDVFEIRIINLKRVREAYQKDKNNKKNQWVMFLEDPNSKEVKEIMEKNEDVKKAVITVREMSADEEMERLAELREKAIKDEKALYNTGIREGKREIALKLLSKNMKTDQVAEITGITKEEIEKLKNK